MTGDNIAWLARHRHLASYRDSAGFIVETEGRILRVMAEAGADCWNAFQASSAGRAIASRGALVPTSQPASVPLALQNRTVLEHARVPVISYPHEWPFAYLKAAALLHLDLMEELVPAGFWLQDADAVNVQRLDGRPVLIDVTSIQLARASVWPAYGQFCETMLFPLLLSSSLGLPINQILGPNKSSVSGETASRMIGLRHAFTPGIALEVWLQAALQRRFGKMDVETEARLRAAKMPPQKALKIVKRLRKLVAHTQAPAWGNWQAYKAEEGYGAQERVLKSDTVEGWLKALPALRLVCDLGANTGHYSRLAARHAALVVATDFDAGCVEAIANNAPDNVIALVNDFSAPTPGSGWRCQERSAFWDRVKPDMVLALALIHHLCLDRLLPLADVVDGLLSVAPLAVIEFVGPADPMADRLLRRRGIQRPDYTESNFKFLLDKRGVEIRAMAKITSNRTLYLLARDAYRYD